MIRRARLLTVLAAVIAGALGVISSTQTWLIVHLGDDSVDALEVAGNVALPVLAPLSLAALALGAALALVGRIARYVFGAMALVLAAWLLFTTVMTAVTTPQSAVARTVTEATGIDGDESVANLIAGIDATTWPWVAAAGFALLAVAGAIVLATAHQWTVGGRRYGAATRRNAAPNAPLDAVDSWDDLSRGSDPTG